jgi:hypothetical protein
MISSINNFDTNRKMSSQKEPCHSEGAPTRPKSLVLSVLEILHFVQDDTYGDEFWNLSLSQ